MLLFPNRPPGAFAALSRKSVSPEPCASKCRSYDMVRKFGCNLFTSTLGLLSPHSNSAGGALSRAATCRCGDWGLNAGCSMSMHFAQCLAIPPMECSRAPHKSYPSCPLARPLPLSMPRPLQVVTFQVVSPLALPRPPCCWSPTGNMARSPLGSHSGSGDVRSLTTAKCQVDGRWASAELPCRVPPALYCVPACHCRRTAACLSASAKSNYYISIGSSSFAYALRKSARPHNRALSLSRTLHPLNKKGTFHIVDKVLDV